MEALRNPSAERSRLQCAVFKAALMWKRPEERDRQARVQHGRVGLFSQPRIRIGSRFRSAMRYSDVTVPAFENVHIYNALAQVLRVTPARNDGNPAVARSWLR